MKFPRNSKLSTVTGSNLGSNNPSELAVNPLSTELNPICHLLALLGAHHILHVSRVRVKEHFKGYFKPLYA